VTRGSVWVHAEEEYHDPSPALVGTTQCNAMQCNAMQYNAIQCNTMQYNTTQCNAMQYNTIYAYIMLTCAECECECHV
jgi:hypothetical protein